MASKIGVYFDVQNIGGGLDVEALAEQVRSKWSDLTPVVKVLPMLSVAEDEVRADIEANGLDGVLFCGASPRDEAAPWQLPVQVEHVNLREQCVLAYKNPDGSAVSGAAPALLTQMATDYMNMGVVKLQKSNMPESAAIEGIKRILVIGGGWTGLTAAQEAAKTGYEVILVEKADKLGGAVNNMPMGSPLQAPWEDRQPTNLAEKIAAVTGNSSITVLLNSHMAKLEGQPGEFKATVATANGEQTFDIGSVVLATGWVPLAEKYLESMGLGVNPKVVHAAQFAKMPAASPSCSTPPSPKKPCRRPLTKPPLPRPKPPPPKLLPRKKKRASSRRTWKASSTCVTPTPSTAWACCAWPTSSVTRPMTPCRPSCCTRT